MRQNASNTLFYHIYENEPNWSISIEHIRSWLRWNGSYQWFFFISKMLLDPSIRFSIKSWPWNDILHDSSSALAELPGLYYVSRHVPRNWPGSPEFWWWKLIFFWSIMFSKVDQPFDREKNWKKKLFPKVAGSQWIYPYIFLCYPTW